MLINIDRRDGDFSVMWKVELTQTIDTFAAPFQM